MNKNHVPVELDSRLWRHENFSQRMLRKDWQAILLSQRDIVLYQGQVRKLIAKHIGAGVYEVFKEPFDKKIYDESH